MFFLATADGDGPAAVLVQGRRAGVRAGAGADGAVLPELRRQRDVPVDGQPGREPGRRDAVHRLRRPDAGPGVGPGDGQPTSRAGRRPTPAPSSSCGSPSTRCSRTARGTSTGWTPASRRRSCPPPTARRRCRTGSGRRGRATCCPPAIPPVADRHFSRRTFLALGATVVAGACSSRLAGRTAVDVRPPPTHDRPRRSTDDDRRRQRPTTTTTATHDDRAAWPPTRSRSVSAPATPTSSRPCCGPGSSARPRRRGRRRVGGRRRRGFADGHGRPARSPRLAADGHSVHVVVELDGPAWYRFRAGGFTSPVGRAAPTATASRRCGWRRRSCQHWETGFYAAHRDIAEWAPDLVVFLGDFIYEGAAAPGRRRAGRAHDGPEPTDLAGYRARYAQYLSDPHLQASRAACPWLVDLGRPRGREQLRRRSIAAGPGRRGDVRRPPRRRLPGVVGAHAGAPPAAGRRRGLPDPPVAAAAAAWPTSILLDGRQFRSDQACGDVTLSTRPAVPGGARPGADDARRRRRRQWLATPFAASTGDVDRARPADRAHRPAPAERGDPQPRPVGRLRAGPGPAARRRRPAPTGSSCSPATSTSPASAACPASAPSSSRRRSRRRATSPVALQPMLRDFPTVVDAELAHRGYTRHTVTPEAWTAEYRIVDDVADARLAGVDVAHVPRRRHGPRPPRHRVRTRAER